MEAGGDAQTDRLKGSVERAPKSDIDSWRLICALLGRSCSSKLRGSASGTGLSVEFSEKTLVVEPPPAAASWASEASAPIGRTMYARRSSAESWSVSYTERTSDASESDGAWRRKGASHSGSRLLRTVGVRCTSRWSAPPWRTWSLTCGSATWPTSHTLVADHTTTFRWCCATSSGAGRSPIRTDERNEPIPRVFARESAERGEPSASSRLDVPLPGSSSRAQLGIRPVGVLMCRAPAPPPAAPPPAAPAGALPAGGAVCCGGGASTSRPPSPTPRSRAAVGRRAVGGGAHRGGGRRRRRRHLADEAAHVGPPEGGGGGRRRGGIRWWASSSSSHASSFACHRSFSCSEATRRAATSAFALRKASVMIAMMIVATTHVHRHAKSSIRMIDDTGSFS